jgi:uncharacterized SAM-binding protein YcdF (DUF218 family)
MALCLVLLLALGFGFVLFVSNLSSDDVTLDRNADGIVVFTGGASRITDAIELLAAGRGKRLLISGVNPSTKPAEILRLNPEFARVVSCCIDTDQSVNTLGNAIETKRWAESRGFRSLIVVTSSYHMPRAMAELQHQLPGVTLIAFPVVSERLRGVHWWSSVGTMRLMLSEYLKYIYARMRITLDPNATAAVAPRSRLGATTRPMRAS